MSEEKTPVTDTVEVSGDKAEIKALFRKYASILYWLPIAICGMLGIVLLLAPLAYLLPGTLTLLGKKINLAGYDVFEYMSNLDEGLSIPVVLIIIVGAVSVVFAVLSGIFRKFRQSIFCDVFACIITVAAFAIGVGQTAWLNASTEYNGAGTFPVLCLVFGLIFTLFIVGELVIHWLFIATQNDKIEWKAKFNSYKAWLYLLPALVILAIFTVWPIINTIRISFMNGYNYNEAVWKGDGAYEFGVDNFLNVVGFQDGHWVAPIDNDFLVCLKNTVLLTVITVPISTMLALIIAAALNSIKFVRKTLQTIFFLPYVTNTIAIGMVFMAMFSWVKDSSGSWGSFGVINNIIGAFGGKPIDWVNSGNGSGGASFANYAVLIIYIVWNALPFKILILLGGLQSVNKQYYEAAKIDGTSRLRTFWRITVPMLSPMIAYVVITGFIGGFKEYSSVVGIFGENMAPQASMRRSLDTMVGYIYNSLNGNNHGRASAAALILFAIIFVVTMINMYVSKKKVHY